MKLRQVLLLLLLAGLMISTGHAASYYSDPVNGSMSNDGSEANPWSSMRDIFQVQTPFNAGDVLYLMNGAHGQSYISEAHTNYVTIRPYPGHNPRVSTVLLDNGASYWAFDGITFTVDGTGGPTTRNYLISMTGNASYLKVENCLFHSAEDSSGWSKADWYAHAIDGVYLDGDHIIFNSNTIMNVYHALRIEGDFAEVKNNLIDNFGADAIRALSSHAVYENNTIRDAYIEDYYRNHDDAIQMYDKDNIPGGMVEDVLIRNNTIYTFADPITQAMIDDDLVGYSMQGIIVTDGSCNGVVVENNLVVGDHYHGITLSGPIDCRIQNNTVIKTPTSVNPVADALPWVQLDESKRGIQPANSIIRNNIASKLTPWTYAAGTNILDENNQQPDTAILSSYFTDYTGFDLTLKPGSPAIDTGTNVTLTATDLAGLPRLAGPVVDCGAYEYQSTSDSFPPVITQANDTYFNDEVVIVFNKSVVAASAEDHSNYAINGGVTVTNAFLAPDNTTVTLQTTALFGGGSHLVVANGVEDYAGNMASNTMAEFSYRCDASWASTFQDDQWGTHPPENAFDGTLATKWAAEGTEWIQTSFCRELIIESVDIAFTLGNQRSYSFTIDISSDGRTFTQIFSGASSGTSTALENFNFSDIPAKYIKINGQGNSVNDWNNYAEIDIHYSDPARTEYEKWIADFPAVGIATNLVDDPDNDQLNNLGEWGFDGKPDDFSNQGQMPTLQPVDRIGWIEYIHLKRRNADAFGLTYRIEQTTDLNGSNWSNAWYEVVGGSILIDEYNVVTNRITIDRDSEKFIRLILDMQFY